jgi:hypothetical protein
MTRGIGIFVHYNQAVRAFIEDKVFAFIVFRLFVAKYARGRLFPEYVFNSPGRPDSFHKNLKVKLIAFS